MATSNAAVETLNTENTAANTSTVNTETEIVKAVLENPQAQISDFVTLAKGGFYDAGFVNLLQDVADKVALKMEPKNYDAEIEKLQSELLATKDTERRMSLLLQVQDLLNEQKNEGSEIRTRLNGVSFHEIAVAYSKDIQALVDGVVVEFLKKGQYQTLKSKRAPRSGSTATTAPAAPAEQITFEYKGATHTVRAGKGRLNTDLSALAEEHAKAVKDDEAKKKPNFIQALKDGKVKGAKVTKVETV